MSNGEPTGAPHQYEVGDAPFGDGGVPNTIDRYSILKKIATGGMAELFLAKQSGLEGFEKVVVIKRILRNLAEDDEFVSMFLDEARIAAKLSHPNIVQIYDLGKADDTHYIAMEYVSGRNVQHLMTKQAAHGGFIPIEHACRIVAGVCEGLHYAHSRKDFDGKPLNIVHRDISPQNILVSFAGGVKVVDFGIAKASTQLAHTRDGVLKGKYAYMSPEQVRGQPIDHRSDLFALGLVFYELLTGRRAFEREDSLKTLKAIVQEKPVNPRELNPDIPAEVVSLLSRALAKSPDRRYANAQDFQIAIEDYLETSPRKSNTVRLSRYMNEVFEDELNSGNNTMVVQGLGAIIMPTNVEANDGDEPSVSDDIDEHTLSSLLHPEGYSAEDETVVPGLSHPGLLNSDVMTAAEETLAGNNLHVAAAEESLLSSADATIPVQALVMPTDETAPAASESDDPSQMPTRASPSLQSIDSIASDELTIGEVPKRRGQDHSPEAIHDSVEVTAPGVGTEISTEAGKSAASDASSSLASEDSLAVRLLAKVDEMAQDVDVPVQSEAPPRPPSFGRAVETLDERPRGDKNSAPHKVQEPSAGIRPAMESPGIRPAATPAHRPVIGGAQGRENENSAREYRAPLAARPSHNPREHGAAFPAPATTPGYILWGGVCVCLVVILSCVAFLWNDMSAPSASEASMLQTRFVKFDSVLPNATATIGGKTKSLPATFMVPVSEKVPVTLRSGNKSRVFDFEFAAGTEMLEQQLSLDTQAENVVKGESPRPSAEEVKP